MRGRVSAYLMSALKRYFGEEKGERIAQILERSGIFCFDDLSSDVPDDLIELMEVTRSEFNGFLEEYGPQAIARLKERVNELLERVRELKTQMDWARERILKGVEARASSKSIFMRELEVVMGIISSVISSVQLCCGREATLDGERMEIYSKPLKEAAERLRRICSIDDEFSGQLSEVATSLDRIAGLPGGLTAGDLIDLLSYALSLLSDVRRARGGVELDKESLILENIILKSKLVSLICQKICD